MDLQIMMVIQLLGKDELHKKCEKVIKMKKLFYSIKNVFSV